MSSKEVNNSRRRSRPVTKPDMKTKMKRNKPAMFLAIFIVLMLVLSGVYVIISNLGGGGASKGDLTYSSDYPVAIFDTTMGKFAVELYTDKVPITAGNFIDLAKDNFYDGVLFHRVIKDFMIQSGDPLSKDDDPTNDGTGGPGYKIDDEFHPDLKNIRGTISMANSGENTGGSQFFINVVDNNHLDYDTDPRYKHAVFGTVIVGMDVVDNISNVDVDGSRPKTDVVINSITIENE